MADLVDIASGTIEAFLASAALRQRGKSDPANQDGFSAWDGIHCVEEHCGVEIPERRRANGYCRCVDCQGLKERGKL